jgi:hypothetical protein
MQIRARLPLLFTGTPAKNTSSKKIFVSKDFDWEVPEVTMNDMPIAFQAHTTHVLGISRADNQQVRRPLPIRRILNLRELNGNLYCKVAEAGADIQKLFSVAFPSNVEEMSPDYAAISYIRRDQLASGLFSLPSLSIFNQIRWHESCLSMSNGNHVAYWPTKVDGQRNCVALEDVLPKLMDFDEQGLEKCMDMYPHHMSKFVISDGELWMKTPPPAIKVQRIWVTGKVSVAMSISLAPNYHDTALHSAVFDLTARDQALDYAKNMLRIDGLGRPPEDCELLDMLVDYEAPDPSLLMFDHDGEELRRLSSAFAVESYKFAMRNEGWVKRQNVGSHIIDGIHQSYEEVIATNYVTGDYGDSSPWLEANAEFWRATGKRTSTYNFGQSHTFKDYQIERALSLKDNTPVYLDLSAGVRRASRC